MRKYRIYSRYAIHKVINEPNGIQGISTDEAEKLLTEKGCTIVDKTPFTYTQAELDYTTKRYHKKYPGSFPNG